MPLPDSRRCLCHGHRTPFKVMKSRGSVPEASEKRQHRARSHMGPEDCADAGRNYSKKRKGSLDSMSPR